MNKERKSDQDIIREKKREILLKNHKSTYNKNVPNAIKVVEFKKLKTNGTLIGRVMAKRDMGKSFFIDLLDETGTIQLYVNLKSLSEMCKKNLDLVDIGDIISISGEYFLTRTKEETVKVKELFIRTKALTPLPNKFTKLKDPEELIRKRYLDLLLNKKRRDILAKRTIGNNIIREFLKEKYYIEVQTPHLHTIATGAMARPFLTHHNTLNIDMYMRIAPELFLKRLIMGNLGKVFEIARCYRNEGISNKHNPEFDMLEVYKMNGSVSDMEKLAEEIVKKVALAFWNKNANIIKNNEINIKKPFKRTTINQLIKENFKVDILKMTLEEAKKIAKSLNVSLKDLKIISNGTIMKKIFDDKIEENIIDPTFVYGYPVEYSPLAKVSLEDDRIASRFELFIGGFEVANGYDEQNDYFEQKKAFDKQQELKKKGDDEITGYDKEYLTMLRYGLPPTGGLGIGLDRLYMILLNLETIKDIILFPTVKPI